MLLIVINHKQTENEQPGENAAHDLAGPMKIPKRPRQGNRQEKRGGNKIPPAPPRVIRCVRLGCQYEFFTCSHTRSSFLDFRFRCQQLLRGGWDTGRAASSSSISPSPPSDGGEGGERRCVFIGFPSPRSSPHSFLAGRGWRA